MVLAQNWTFLQLFFLGNIGHRNVFYDILERNNIYLSDKKKEVKNGEKLTFFQRG